MRVSIVGTGYVGLVTGACLAELGHSVTCVDLDPARVAAVNEGRSPIHEEGLDELLDTHAGHRLEATTDLEAAVRASDISIIAVGTPFDGETIDLSQVKQVAGQIGRAIAGIDRYHVVLVKSTVVPGTTDTVVGPILEASSGKRAGLDFGVGMNPEFLREGIAVADTLQPDRIVIGGIDEQTMDTVQQLFQGFIDDGVELIRTSPRTAETIKYASNALFATLISFSNEIGNLCATMGDLDVKEVMRGVQLDRRLSPVSEDGSRIVPEFTTYLEAGCGFGGSCFPKDIRALVSHGQQHGLPMDLLDSVLAVNALQPATVLPLIEKHFDSYEGLNIALLGLAFKPGTDDVRESPSLDVARQLVDLGASVAVHDPAALSTARIELADLPIRYESRIRDAIANADVILLMTRWDHYLDIPQRLAGLSSPPLVVDGRRMLDRESIHRYEGIGLSNGDGGLDDGVNVETPSRRAVSS